MTPILHPSLVGPSPTSGSSRLSTTIEHPCIFSPSRRNLDENRKRRRRALSRCAWTRNGISASASPVFTSQTIRDLSHLNGYEKVIKAARDSFTREVSFQSKDMDISLAKALLYIAAEDEAFIALNKEIDDCAIASERENFATHSLAEWNSLEQMPLAGRTIDSWLSELDFIARDVLSELGSRKHRDNLVEILDAVNEVLFGNRGLKRSHGGMDAGHCYLHTALSAGIGSAILLSVIYMEVCKRIKVDMVGSRVGEDFLIWPHAANLEELFNETSGRSLFAIVNGSSGTQLYTSSLF